MNKNLSFYLKAGIHLAILASLPMAANAATPAMPNAPTFTDYAGDSFTLNWNAVDGASSYLVNVFSVSDTEKANVTEKFSGVNHTNDKIDTANPNYPEGWDIDVTTNGSVDMATPDGKNDYIVLDADGDYIATPPFSGVFDSFTISALLFDAEGITEENSSTFKVELFDDHGNSLLYGQVAALYFGSVQTLDAFQAVGFNTGNVAKIKISLVRDETHKVGNLMITSIDFSYYKRDFIATAQTTKTSYKVTEADPEKAYFANVAAKNDDGVSQPSELTTIDGFLTPVATSATGITATGYTATWDKTPKASKYIVNNYNVTEITEDGSYAILHDDFAKATEGTRENPVSVDSPDAYTIIPGWGGNKYIIAEGMLGGDEGTMRPRPNPGYLQTPSLDLSADGGKYTISIKAYGEEGDYLSVYRVGYTVDGQLNIHSTTPFPASGYIEETWEMEDGASDMKISIEPKNMKRFFLDEITISQKMTKGSFIKKKISSTEVDAPATSLAFDGLDANGKYGYDLTAIRYDSFGYEETSEPSNFVVVQLAQGGVESAATTKTAVRISGGQLQITAAASQPVYLYTIDGSLAATATTTEGTTSMPVESNRPYILKVGADVFKIISK